MNMYKRGYHILIQRLKVMTKDNKSLKKEVSRLNNVLHMHEDLMFSFI